MNSYISIHNGVDAEVKLQEGDTYEALILKVTDSNKFLELRGSDGYHSTS